MTTKYDIGDSVYIDAKVESIEVTKFGITYKISMKNSVSNTIVEWFKEDSIHRRIVSKKEDTSNAET